MRVLSKILLVERDLETLLEDRAALEAEGYKVWTAPTLDEARVYLEKTVPDLVILDVVLPDGSGIEFCREIRLQSSIPLFFLIGADQKEVGIYGLKTGADLFIIRPYKEEELIESVRTLARRIKIERERAMKHLEYGPLTIDMVSRRAYLDGEDVLLKPKEFGILFMLIRNMDQACTSEDIYESVWGLPPNSDLRTIRVHVSNLRKKLKMDEDSVIKICYSHGEGYWFTMED